MRHDTWMTMILRTQRCAILILSHAYSRDEMCLCCVQRCTCCICGCTVHTSRRLAGGFLQVTETCPNCEKNNHCQDLKSAENSNCSSSSGFGPTLTTMTKLLASWPATLCGTSNLFSGQLRGHILRCHQIVALFAVLFADCEDSVFFLDSFQVLVMQSFAFSSDLSKVGSLIGWKLSSSFRSCCKNPIIRNLNSFSSRSLVDVRLQGDPVVQFDVVFSPSDVRK